MNTLPYTITFLEVLCAILAFGAATFWMLWRFACRQSDDLDQIIFNREVSISELVAKVKELESVIAQKDKDLLDQSTKIFHLEKKNLSLTSELHEVKTYLQSAETECDELKSKCERLQKQILRTGFIRLDNGRLMRLDGAKGKKRKPKPHPNRNP